MTIVLDREGAFNIYHINRVTRLHESAQLVKSFIINE